MNIPIKLHPIENPFYWVVLGHCEDDAAIAKTIDFISGNRELEIPNCTTCLNEIAGLRNVYPDLGVAIEVPCPRCAMNGFVDEASCRQLVLEIKKGGSENRHLRVVDLNRVVKERRAIELVLEMLVSE